MAGRAVDKKENPVYYLQPLGVSMRVNQILAATLTALMSFFGFDALLGARTLPTSTALWELDAALRSAEVCNGINEHNWWQGNWPTEKAPEVCRNKLRLYLYNDGDYGRAVRPCIVEGLAFLCLETEGRLEVYEVMGYNHLNRVFLSRKELKEIEPHVFTTTSLASTRP